MIRGIARGAMATIFQLERARELIDRLDREVCLKERHNGYNIRKPGSTCIGYVRFNIARKNAGRYVVYAYPPYVDPEGRFQEAGHSRPGWNVFITPEDAELIQYTLQVLRSAYDAR